MQSKRRYKSVSYTHLADAADVAPDAENPLDGTPEDGDDGPQEAEPPEIGSSDTGDGGDSEE